MAKEKMNVESNEELKKEVVSLVSLPVTRKEYTDRKTKETLFEYHVDVNRKGKTFLIKITCIEKDIQLFDILDLMFEYGEPRLVREVKQYENQNGELLDTIQYFVVSDIDGEEHKIRVKPMKESDKLVAELEFKRLEAEAAK